MRNFLQCCCIYPSRTVPPNPCEVVRFSIDQAFKYTRLASHQIWYNVLVCLTLRKLRLKDHEFKARLVCIARLTVAIVC